MNPDPETDVMSYWSEILNYDGSGLEDLEDIFDIPDPVFAKAVPSNTVVIEDEDDAAREDRIAKEQPTEPTGSLLKRTSSLDHRRQHLTIERRRRRQNINNKIEILRQMTPNSPPKLGTAATLEIIVKYLENLKLEAQNLHKQHQAEFASQAACYAAQAPLFYPYMSWNTEMSYYPLGVPTLLPQNHIATSSQRYLLAPNQEDNDLLDFPPRST